MPAARRLLRVVDPVLRPDGAQRDVLAFEGPAALVLGAPGVGKTSVAVEVIARRVRSGVDAGACLLLTASRGAAETLRDHLVRSLGVTTTEPIGRTLPGLAFAVLREAALRSGTPLPRLINGAEQDLILRDLLAGHAAGAGRIPQWPVELRASLSTTGFRSELRDLLMRAVEHDVSPGQLRDLGARQRRPVWTAAADVLEEYQDILALAWPGAQDAAGACDEAARLLDSDEVAAARWHGRLRCLVVDDAQEITVPAARLVAALCGPATRLLVLADPDAATQAFRGAQPELAEELVRAVDADAPTFVLGTAWRQTGALRAVTGAVAARIGTVAGVSHRRPAEPQDPRAGRPGVVVQSFESDGAHADHLAAALRRDHLLDGVPWSDLAVLTRTAGAAQRVRAELIRRGVPVRLPAERPHLPLEPAVAPLLTILEIAADRARGTRGTRGTVAPELVEPLVRSVYGSVDALAWRRLIRTAAAAAPAVPAPVSSTAAAAESRGTDVLGRWLVEGMPPAVARQYPGMARVAAMIAAAQAVAVWDRSQGRWDGSVTAATVLWAAWSTAGKATAWQDRARRDGIVAARADRDLDAVLSLFDAADRYDDYGAAAGPDGFVTSLRAMEFTAEPLEPRARRECVEVCTVHGAVGRQWRRVAVIGVQDGVWPDVRRRGSVLGADELVDVLRGRHVASRAMLEAARGDETRLFHVAVSRASERLRVTAVDNEDDEPSTLFHLIASVPGVEVRLAGQTPQDQAVADGELSLAAVTGRLRRVATEHPEARIRDGAARRLAALAAADVPGADPAGWWQLAAPSDRRPLRELGASVQVSPSGLDDLQRCPLRWLIRAAGGGRTRADGPARVGDLVHEILAAAHDFSADALQERLDQAWPGLGLTPGWLERRARRDATMMISRASRYVQQAETAGRREVARELPVTLQVGHCTLTARIDRVEQEPDGRLRVIDFKTGTTKPTAAELARSPQLGAYQVGAGQLGEVSGASFVQLGRAANQQVTMQDQAGLRGCEDPEWATRMIVESGTTMAGPRFEARRGPWCRTCEAVLCCPAGKRS